MALDGSVTIVPGRGHYYTAPVGTTKPTTPTDPTNGGAGPWVEVGHTQRDTPLQVSREGDDPEVLGSWQDPNLRTRQNPPTFSLAFGLLQYDAQNLPLYYGSNAEVDADGWVQVPKVPVATESALFVRVVDGNREHYRHYPRVSILAADSEEFDVEALASMPVAATILGAEGSDFGGSLSPVEDTSSS